MYHNRANMNFSYFVELVNVNKSKDQFYLESIYIFSYSGFYWFRFNRLIGLVVTSSVEIMHQAR